MEVEGVVFRAQTGMMARPISVKGSAPSQRHLALDHKERLTVETLARLMQKEKEKDHPDTQKMERMYNAARRILFIPRIDPGWHRCERKVEDVESAVREAGSRQRFLKIFAGYSPSDVVELAPVLYPEGTSLWKKGELSP